MRWRLMLSFFFIVLISVGSVVVLARLGAANEVRAFMFRGGMGDIENLASALEKYYRDHGSWAGVESLLDSPGHGRGHGMMPGMGGMMNQRFILADGEGYVVFDSSAARLGSTLSAAELDQSVVLKSGQEQVGYLYAEGGMRFSSQEERLLVDRLTRAALIAGAIGGILSLLFAGLLAEQLFRPLRTLTQAATRLGRGDLKQRVPVKGSDELAELARTFNHMAASLEEVEERRRAMTADIAHELRTPLAVQRASIEALQDGIYPLTPDQLQPVLEQNLLLTRLVEDLRTLALADAGELSLQKSMVDFSSVVRKVMGQFAPQAASRGIALVLEPSELFQVEAFAFLDADRVEQIINNLLSNALRYTPPGGSIRLRLRSEPEQISLQVHDSGPGIPEEALGRIFERFYRVDKARSRSDGGSGLGLAIAAQLAQAHGGSLTAENHPQGGASFTLTLPRGEPTSDSRSKPKQRRSHA